MKKGEMYFNWVFIVIVGAVFLLFFFGFAVKYKDLQEKKSEIIFLNNFDSALTNLQSSTFTTSTSIEIPIDVSVNCDNRGYNIFINEKNDVDYIIASEEKLNDKIHIWYKPYKIPFQATNFYYIIDDSLNVLTNNVDLVNSLKGEMPENFKSRINVYQGNKLVINGDENKGTISRENYISLRKSIRNRDFKSLASMREKISKLEINSTGEQNDKNTKTTKKRSKN